MKPLDLEIAPLAHHLRPIFGLVLSLSIQLQEVAAAHFNVHEHYDDRTLENDICVVILAAPLRFSQSSGAFRAQKNILKMFPIFSFLKDFF